MSHRLPRFVLVSLLLFVAATPARAQWRPDGIPVDVGHGNPSELTANVNANGQFLLLWDATSETGGTDVRVQRFSPGGTTPWGDPILVAPGNGVSGGNVAIFVVPDAGQGAIVGYRRIAGDWRMQRYAANGHPQWGTEGLPFLHTTRGIPEQNSFLGLAGGDFLEYGNLHDSLVVQRYSGETGTPVWPQPTQVCTANSYHFADTGVEHGPWMVDDGTGGVVSTWADGRGTFVQRITGDGRVLWTPFGARVSLSTDNRDVRLTSDGHGGAILTWSYGPDPAIYVQHVVDGQVQWGENGVALEGFEVLGLAPDGAGGAWIVDRKLTTDRISPMLVQHVTAAGALAGPPTLIPLPTPAPDGVFPLAVGHLGDACWVVEHVRGNFPSRMVAHIVSADGSLLGGPDGLTVISGPFVGFVAPLAVVSDARGGLFAAFDDVRLHNENADLFATELQLPRNAGGQRKLAAPAEPTLAVASTVHSGYGATLHFTLAHPARVDVLIVGVTGRLARRMVIDELEGDGGHDVHWDGTDGRGKQVPPGLYFARVRAGDEVAMTRVVLTR